MTVITSLLRAVNLAGHRKIKMEALRALYESLGLQDVRTFIQSGNVVFRTKERNLVKLASRIEDAIEEAAGFRAEVILRTIAEMKDVIRRNPVADREGVEPGKLVVTFLAGDPGEAARELVRNVPANPEELWIDGRELYIYFPNGMGKTKLPLAAIAKKLKVPGTARNWNSVLKLLEMAEKLDQ